MLTTMLKMIGPGVGVGVGVDVDVGVGTTVDVAVGPLTGVAVGATVAATVGVGVGTGGDDDDPPPPPPPPPKRFFLGVGVAVFVAVAVGLAVGRFVAVAVTVGAGVGGAMPKIGPSTSLPVGVKVGATVGVLLGRPLSGVGIETLGAAVDVGRDRTAVRVAVAAWRAVATGTVGTARVATVDGVGEFAKNGFGSRPMRLVNGKGVRVGAGVQSNGGSVGLAASSKLGVCLWNSNRQAPNSSGATIAARMIQ
ncbi:MAG: hypothetical protein IIB16_01540 [Chloroflexi bacterium]|nr:hypothetical protein [Chloroflexota bacterium]